jgi:prepilin-type N-terminal cleavage/methylation domain-containing protein
MKITARGFTLIEMSIVLVIIGLLVGGVLVGQTLILSAQIKAFGSTVAQLDTAVNTFRGKYDCLPGDCANATTFFGGGCTMPWDGTISHIGTCNGNGDGDIYSLAPGNDAPNGGQENAYFFQQLVLAGLIADTRYCTQNNITCQVAYPTIDWGLAIPWPSTIAGFPSALAIVSLVHATWAGPAAMGGSQAYFISGHPAMEYPSFSPALLQQIDTKYDDGYPLSGIIQTIGFAATQKIGAGVKYGFNGTFDQGNGTCYNTSVTPNAYSTGTGVYCPAMWKAGF